MPKLPAVALLLVLSFGAARAAADDVPPPPASCPAGSRGVTGHAGPACVPADCRNDSDCKNGEGCREQPLCVRVEEFVHHRRSDQKLSRTVVASACGGGSGAGPSCSEPHRCNPGKRCVPASAPAGPGSATPTSVPASGAGTAGSPSPKAGGGSSCAHAGGPPTAPGAAWLLALGVAAWRSLRRRHTGR
jgi:hypothetical protein